MIRRRRFATVALVLAAGVPLSACRGEILAFDPGQQSTGSNAVAVAPSLPGSVAALSDSDALQLCNWLYATWPGDKPDGSLTAVSPAPGYVAGPAFGCPDLPLWWALLSPQDCVLNLRHSACEGAVSDLEQCASYGAGTMYSTFLAGGDGCGGWSTACAAFLSAPGCEETVFQDSPGSEGDTGYKTGCASALPVEPDVTCPAVGSDAGAE